MYIVYGIIVGMILGLIGALGGTLYGLCTSNVVGEDVGCSDDFAASDASLTFHVKTDTRKHGASF